CYTDITMEEQLTRRYFDKQFEFLARAVKEGFDNADKDRTGMKVDIAGLKTDVADLKTRMRAVEDETQILSANMVTKQYFDAKFDRLVDFQHKDILFKKRLLSVLEEAKVLPPETRQKLEQLIPVLASS
ncbi:MAG: hypothetical protein ABIG71_00035, partial [Candidatus Uhrbacteria bacterium]